MALSPLPPTITRHDAGGTNPEALRPEPPFLGRTLQPQGLSLGWEPLPRADAWARAPVGRALEVVGGGPPGSLAAAAMSPANCRGPRKDSGVIDLRGVSAELPPQGSTISEVPLFPWQSVVPHSLCLFIPKLKVSWRWPRGSCVA